MPLRMVCLTESRLVELEAEAVRPIVRGDAAGKSAKVIAFVLDKPSIPPHWRHSQPA